ncbi:MAG: 50S ribosomal protein L4 [Vicinamibacteria bacterium]|nr:50S ribosomal protein L4 [Vicinamibacteria bacterium]
MESSRRREKNPTVSRNAVVIGPEIEPVGEVTLSPEVFGVGVNAHLLYEAVKQDRSGMRRGTHMTKNRALVSGSGRKPWRQKGTGRARVGESRNPLWRHGGTVFGPTPRDYGLSMPRSARLAALRAALSQKASEGALKVVQGFRLQAPKTRELRSLLARMGINGKALLVDAPVAEALALAGRNLAGVHVVDPYHMTVYDVLNCRTIVISQEALRSLEERLTP